jgi:hypothetical protein
MESSTGPGPEREQVTLERIMQLLAQGTVKLQGQIPSSNIIFLAAIEDADLEAWAIYKPQQGERPLWDFPEGTLCLRETAAYILSQILGWPAVPPTVLRDGPYGLGTIQLFIEADYEQNYFTCDADRQRELQEIALFDLMINNADRKGGHLLFDSEDRMWAIDHALAFHPEPKLRTVIWDFAGEPLPGPLRDDVRELLGALEDDGPVRQPLGRLLAGDELTALRERAERLLASGAYPEPDPDRRQVPWPLI